MVTKAIVEEVIDPYSARVRIPIFHKIGASSFATINNELPIAPICAMPGSTFTLKPGSIVYVAFELGKPERPVIMGVLSRPEESASSDLSVGSLKVDLECTLPDDLKLSNKLNQQIYTFQDYVLNSKESDEEQ